MKAAAYRAANRALARFGFKLERIEDDFDAFVEHPDLQRRIFCELGSVADEWLATQNLFTVRSRFKGADAVQAFFNSYIRAPFREKGGGSRFNNADWLYLIAKAMEPTIIIDSGTYRGASAWALGLGAPAAKLFSFDIDLSRLAVRVEGATYREHDWTAYQWDGIDLSRSLIYFDDHLDQARRLLESAERRVSLAIFDDDFPVTSFAPVALKGKSLPKVEFLLDDELRRFTEVAWTERGVRRSFPVDLPYWDRARACIAGTDRLPNTSLVTGIHQTPYRIVKVRPTRPAAN